MKNRSRARHASLVVTFQASSFRSLSRRTLSRYLYFADGQVTPTRFCTLTRHKSNTVSFSPSPCTLWTSRGYPISSITHKLSSSPYGRSRARAVDSIRSQGWDWQVYRDSGLHCPRDGRRLDVFEGKFNSLQFLLRAAGCPAARRSLGPRLELVDGNVVGDRRPLGFLLVTTLVRAGSIGRLRSTSISAWRWNDGSYVGGMIWVACLMGCISSMAPQLLQSFDCVRVRHAKRGYYGLLGWATLLGTPCR